MVGATGIKYQISNICCLEYNCMLLLNTRRIKMNIILSRAGDPGSLAGVMDREAVLVENAAPGTGFMLFGGSCTERFPYSTVASWTRPSQVNGG